MNCANFILIDRLIEYFTSSHYASNKGTTISMSAVGTTIVLALLLVMSTIGSNYPGTHVAIVFAQLSDDSKQIECNEDEVEEDGQCVPQPIECNEDEVEEDGQCEPTQNNNKFEQSSLNALGTLIVIKQVINDNGGINQPGDFNIRVEGVDANPDSFQGSESGTTVLLRPGGYVVDEDQYSGYETEFSSECEGSIDVSQTKTCTITNDDRTNEQEGIAGDDMDAKEGESVTLRGEIPLGMEGELTWQWKSDDIDVEELFKDNDESSPVREFDAPKVSKDTTLTFQMTVIDSQGNTAMDTVQVRIEDVSTGIGNLPSIVRPGGETSTESRPTYDTSMVPPPTQQYLTYKNDTKAVKMQYPSDWKIIETKANVTFNSPSETPLDSFHEALRVLTIPYRDSLSSLVKQIISDAKPNLPGFELVDSRSTLLNGTSAHSLVYKYRDDTIGPVEQMAVLTVKNGKAYVIGYVAELANYSDYLPVIQKMLGSFEMGPFAPQGSPLLIFS